MYYLENPRGHLMDNIMGSAEGRTKVKGNIFSFSMPWEDIQQCCENMGNQSPAEHSDAIKTLGGAKTVPHSEDTLALLVSVKIVSGESDLAEKLRGRTVHVHVLK